MKEIVLDASAALSWCFEDQATSASTQAMDLLQTGTALVPAIFNFEIANALVVATRRGLIGSDRATTFLGLISSLRMAIDGRGLHRACYELRALAEQEQLSVYDAAYLELAMRAAAPVATLDGPLRQACARRGVVLVGA